MHIWLDYFPRHQKPTGPPASQLDHPNFVHANPAGEVAGWPLSVEFLLGLWCNLHRNKQKREKKPTYSFLRFIVWHIDTYTRCILYFFYKYIIHIYNTFIYTYINIYSIYAWFLNIHKHILVTIIHKPPCICSQRPSHGSAAVKVSRSWSSTEAVETEAALGLQVHAWHGRNFQSLGSILYTMSSTNLHGCFRK